MRTTRVSNPVRSPHLRTSASVICWQPAFAIGVLPDIYRFHPYTSHCWFADGCVFGKQSPGPALCRPRPLTSQGPHFFRSYVCILPSSLTRDRSCALDYSSFLPESVSGTVPTSLALDSISRHHGYLRFASTFSPLARALTSSRGFACGIRQLAPSTGTTVARPDFTSCVLPSKLFQVPDYEPDSHRLRVSASP